MFYPTTYDPDTGAMTVDELTEVAPSSNVVHEVGSASKPSQRKLDRQLERDRWVWQQILEFPVEVSAEAYENLITSEPLYLPRADPLPSIWLELVNAEYDHPPTQGAARGTRIVYSFLAREARA